MAKKTLFAFVIASVCIHLFLCAAPALSETQAVRTYQELSPLMQVDALVFKFYDRVSVRLRNGEFVSTVGVRLDAVNDILQHKPVSPLFERGEEQLESEFRSLKAAIGARAVNKNSYFRISPIEPAEAQELQALLSSISVIESAYVEPKAEPAEDIPPPTPDFSGDQGYLYSPPEGVAADYCWGIPGGTGENVRIIDIEGNWNGDHEDFGDNFGDIIGGVPVPLLDWINHGTASTGIICADSNEYGITGIAHAAEIDLISIDGLGVAAAIDLAASQLQAGDIILIEIHSPGPRYNFEPRPDQMGYVPVEYFMANFDAIQMACAKGIIVVEAGGNGYEDLDDAIYEGLFDRDQRNSRAILVGAGAPPGGEFGPDRTRLYFSNYGSRMDLQGWGKNVVTTGYGGLFNGDSDYDQFYTATFAGTSSASPIVAGAVACIQGIFKHEYGYPMPPNVVSTLLSNTGSLQPNPDEWIGPRPNLVDANQFLPSPGPVASPAFVDTASYGETIVTAIVSLTNTNVLEPIDFEIAINDSIESIAGSGWLAVNPMIGSIGAGMSTDIQVTMDAGLLADTTYNYKGLIEVDYDTWATLEIPVFFTVTCDNNDYAVEDSDNSQSLLFDWRDISTFGIRLEPEDFHNTIRPFAALDDGTSKVISIGFPFNFYNDVFGSIYVGVNGGLSFVSDEINVDGYMADIELPAPGMDALLLPFWNDLTIDTLGSGHGEIYYYNSPGNDSLVIQYNQIGNFGYEADTLITFQVILTSDHVITFQYLDVGIYDLGYSALVGMNRDQGCRMVEYFASGSPIENIIHDSLRIDFTPLFDILMPSGDVNASGSIDIDDVVYLVAYIFISGPPPIPPQSGDCNCSGETDIDDVVYLVNYIFASGPEPCKYNPS